MHSRILGFIICIFHLSIYAAPIWISTEEKNLPTLEMLAISPEKKILLPNQGSLYLAQIPEEKLKTLSSLLHQTNKRCGGFMAHTSQTPLLSPIPHPRKAPNLPNNIRLKPWILSGLQNLDTQLIEKTILTLSAYHNRHYQSPTGVEAATWLANHWKEISQTHENVEVSLFQHDWPQPTVIMKIKGKSDTREGIILGGHLDSIAGFFIRKFSQAPGADDNASGIATITEIARVFLEQNLVPEKDIYLMAYAAEEVGLRGSQEVAQWFSQENIALAGVMQLDMVNYQGSAEDIVFMQDYTDNHQLNFTVELLKTYLPELRYTFDRCGYACSDHASWHNLGYSTVIPFESRLSDSNPYIHTQRDLFENSGDTLHALKFAKLAYAWLVELSGSEENTSIQSTD